jgi:LysR family transcriptional regulator, glycine cleavage system transcriptional activator
MSIAESLPSLGSLQVLEALGRHRRIGIAAQELGLSHAAVSQTVSRLESRYGVQLFTRSSWGVEATPGCQGLIQAYLSASSSLRRALAEVADGGRCHALIPSTAWRWLSLTSFRQRNSTADVSLHTYPDDRPADLARADFAIVPEEHVPASGFKATALYDERLIPVCSPAYAERARIETPAAVARADLIIERSDQWLRWFAHAGLAVEPCLGGSVIADAVLAQESAQQGQGVALTCSLAASAAIARGVLTAPVDISVASGRRWQAIWRQGAPGQEAAMGLLDWCLAELHALATAHVALA